MRYLRLRIACVILSVLRVTSPSAGFVSSTSRLPRSRRDTDSAALDFSSVPCRQHGRGILTMGAAGKKRKKMEKEALKYPDGINKNAARETQKDAEAIADKLLETCAEPNRDLAKIASQVDDLRSRTSPLKPAQSYDLSQDWRLVFASDDDAISTVGTGLHKLPLTRIQDFFLRLSGSSATLRQVEAIEILRVLGPFPNIRNTLYGDCKSTGPTSLKICYTSMIDGTGKETGGSQTGDQDRVVEVDVAFAGPKALIFQSVAKSNKKVSLVFAKEPDLHGELTKLRVAGDKTDKK